MRRIILFVLFSMLIFSLGTAVISADLQDPWVSEGSQGVWGGSFISTEFGSGPKTFNTVIANETSSTAITDGFIFEGLIQVDPVTFELDPVLARDWEVADDNKTWTFYLRKGVEWSDGVEFTADDVIFTLDVIYDESVPTSSRDVMMFDSKPVEYRKIDKYTVEVVTPVVSPTLPYNFPNIIPRHKLYDPWKAGKFNETWGIDADPREIVGTGPFTLGQYRPGERVVMLRNSKYWRRSPDGKPLPYITRWVRPIVESTETELLMFLNGDTQTVAVPAKDYQRVKTEAERGDFSLVNVGPSFATNFLVLNQNPRNPELEEEPWKLEWFSDIRFRRAVAHATDKETMIEQALGGHGQPQSSPVAIPNKFYYNPDLKQYPYNLDKAREELKAAGFYWDDQGKLFDKNGNHVEFTMATNSGNEAREIMMNIYANDLTELGMTVHASPVEFNKLVSQLVSEFDYDAIIIGLTGTAEPSSGNNVYLSSGALHMWNPGQEEPTTEWETRVDYLVNKGKTTIDPYERQKYYFEMQEIFAEELPLIYTVCPELFTAIRDSIQNTRPTSYSDVNWGDAINWNLYELYFSN